MLLINHFQEDDYQKVILNSTTAWQHGVPCSPQGGYLRFPSHEFPLWANFQPPQKPAKQMHCSTCSSDKRLDSHNTLQPWLTPQLSWNHSSLAGVRDIPCLKQWVLPDFGCSPLLQRHVRHLLSPDVISGRMPRFSTAQVALNMLLKWNTKTCSPHTYSHSIIPFQKLGQWLKGEMVKRQRWRERGQEDK